MIPKEELWAIIRRIPRGSVTSYGDVGRALHHPASGYMVGRWMANCPSDVPWWRVVAKDGHIPLSKRSIEHGLEQVRRLHEEGVNVEGGLVTKTAFIYSADLMADD
jgi:methylated-DNA-protein-cysteine methyltransferase-like protein